MPGVTPNRSYPYPTYQDTQDVRQAIEDFATAVDADMANIKSSFDLALNAPTVSLSRTAVQSVPALTPTLIDWDTESYDNNAYWEPGVPTEIVFQDTGIYWLMASTAVNLTADATLREAVVEFVSSGVSTPIPTSNSMTLDQQSATYFSLMVPHIVIAGGETLSVRVTHDAAGPLDIFNARLNVSRISRLLPL